jgi:hypothetical protein
MRALVMDQEAEAEVRRVLAFAEKPENYYIVGPGGFSFQRPPGDDPRHVAHLRVGFRAAFSITRSPDGNLFRHLSISVDSKKLPNPFAACHIAKMFGFTGWDEKSETPPAGWGLEVNKDEHCIVLATRL